ncbi:GNAT family N-acetyltransferase [Pseudooceanicola sp. HF7]|nr:GNAT family N-acetyltransferase [Pseudooceanicola sp. HF7]
MLRVAASEDAALIEGFLSGYPETSMFLRGNLAAHGIGDTADPQATDFFLWFEEDELRGVVGLTRSGFLMCQMPGQGDAAFAAVAKALEGHRIVGLTGAADQAERFLAALGLDPHLRVNHVEPLYRLELSSLATAPLICRPAEQWEIPMLTEWFAEYETDTGLAPLDPEELRTGAIARAERAAGHPDCRLLMEKGRPVAMAALNARAGDHVQVGGVFTPRDYRNRGYGRQATQALLLHARSQGARVAFLFANNPAAARAYEAIGFRQIGEYRVALTNAPVALEVS